jgi:serine/threonine protein kinase
VVTDFEVAKRLLAHGVRVALAGRRLPHAAVTDWPLVLRLAANAFWGMLAPHRSRVALSRIIRTGSPSAIIDELGQSPRTPWEGAWSEGSVVGAYVIASKLQQTRFSVVFEAFHLSKGGKFAFKVMNDPAQAQAEFTTYTAIRDCPFIVRVRSRTDWGFFMEYYAGGDLIDWFNRNRRPFTVDEARVAIFRVLKALEWLHDHGVAHLDIKLDNILLAGGMDTFLADFGLAMTITQQPFKYRLVMSDGYRPPELLDKQPFTHKVDMWGAGVTLYLMLTGLPPFNNDDAARKASWPQANITSRDAREVIGGLLIADPGERWTAARALKHQFFTGLDLSVQTKAALKDVGPDDAAFVGAGYSH